MSDKNRRKYERIESSLPVRFTSSGGVNSGQILNLSCTGLCIGTDKPLAAGSSINTDFTLPGSENLFRIPGKVVWIRPDETVEGPTGMGVEFTNVPEKDKAALLHYLVRCQMTVKGY